MPVKGDITDLVEAHSHLSTNELISQLESAAAIANQRQEQSKIEAEQQEKA